MLHLIAVNGDRKVLRHLSAFNGFYANLFNIIAEINQFLVAVELTPKGQAAGPGKDGRYRVGGSGLSCLVIPEVAGNGAVCGFRLHGFTIGRYQHGGHQAERPESLRH